MTLELSISTASAHKAKNTHYLRMSEDESAMEGLSLAEKETFNLARKAETGDSAWDKAILNLVHPPALMLFALLDSGRKAGAPPLPQVQEAYSDVAKATQKAATQNGDGTYRNADFAKTGMNDAKSASTISVQATTAPSASSADSAAASSAAKTIIA
ncbi:hypothetical protein [Rhizobium sp.]|jgi:hypothetical protein|uniref:hypothetical protein n=1 Tax=Rhizobium sp. TaxID=391 RepID=UPI000E9EE06F|nr:hypothetical protein [Rhizobium sp.]